MLATRATAAKKTREKAANKQRNEHRASKVLAERNQAVVAVGAWVEDGQEFEEHPCVSARRLPCNRMQPLQIAHFFSLFIHFTE